MPTTQRQLPRFRETTQRELDRFKQHAAPARVPGELPHAAGDHGPGTRQGVGLANQAHQDRRAALGPGAGELDRGCVSWPPRNAPSPLYERYETAWHASPLIGTIAFAAYAVAVIVGLLCLE